jgi:hypothetical protein
MQKTIDVENFLRVFSDCKGGIGIQMGREGQNDPRKGKNKEIILKVFLLRNIFKPLYPKQTLVKISDVGSHWFLFGYLTYPCPGF